jgi:hypothetical protein
MHPLVMRFAFFCARPIVPLMALCYCSCAQPSISRENERQVTHNFDFPIDQAAAVGIDYVREWRLAHTGDKQALSILLKVTEHLDGGGSLLHCGYLRDFLILYGDRSFATVLSQLPLHVRESVIDSLDFEFVVVRKKYDWSKLFPTTYRLASHRYLLLYRHPPGRE